MMRFVVFPCLVLVLAACQTDGARTVTGQNLGQGEWKTISLQESRLEVPREVREIIEDIQVRKLPGRLQEHFTFRNNSGFGFVEETTDDGGFRKPVPKNSIKSLFAGMYFGETPLGEEAISIQQGKGFYYNLVDRGDWLCIQFLKSAGDLIDVMGGSGTSAVIRGVYCSPNKNTVLANFEELIRQVNLKK